MLHALCQQICSYKLCMIYLYTDTLDLLVVRLVRKRNSDESEELRSNKRQRSSNDSEGMYCYCNKAHIIIIS